MLHDHRDGSLISCSSSLTMRNSCSLTVCLREVLRQSQFRSPKIMTSSLFRVAYILTRRQYNQKPRGISRGLCKRIQLKIWCCIVELESKLFPIPLLNPFFEYTLSHPISKALLLRRGDYSFGRDDVLSN